ncbi:MAG: molecular chaperone Skp [Bacteroidetes bacterium]|nr:molecular chaperone Skp [Bacteroidota bacterium]
MNKNVSIGLFSFLILAVGVLYYFHFLAASHRHSAESVENDSLTAAAPVVAAPKDIKASKIVYVNIDVLNEKYEFLKDISSAAKSEHTSLQNQFQSKGEKLQKDYDEFQQSAQGGLLSENQINQKQEEFAKRKEELDQIQMRADDLMTKIQDESMKAMENVKNYITEYNKNSNAYDITAEILEGINAQYKAEKAAKKKK